MMDIPMEERICGQTIKGRRKKISLQGRKYTASRLNTLPSSKENIADHIYYLPCQPLDHHFFSYVQG